MHVAKLLEADATIVATLTYDDNYSATYQNEALPLFDKALEQYKHDLIIAGLHFMLDVTVLITTILQ